MNHLAGDKFGQVKDAYRVRNRIGGEERFLVCREGEVFGIAAAVFLVRELGRKVEERLSGSRVEHRDFVAVGECNKEPRVAAIEKESGRVGAAGNSRSGFAK